MFSLSTLALLLLAAGQGYGSPVPTPDTIKQKPLRVSSSLNPYPNQPRLTFHPSTSTSTSQAKKTFKLSVFSDLHFGENPWDWWGPWQDAQSLRVMRTLLQVEKPDYVVINGDLITGDNTFAENATTLVDTLLAPLLESKTPFSSTYGNHDNHKNLSHLDEILREGEVAAESGLSYTRRSPAGVGGEGGEGNYWVPIYADPSDEVPVLVLWFFDSRGGWSKGESSHVIPDWVDESVAGWIERETRKMDEAWGPPGDKRAALGFVHISPHVMSAMQKDLDSEKEPGLNEDQLGGPGSTQSTNIPGEIERDIPFWKTVTRRIKNLHALVSGHNHGNEWCKRNAETDLVLCFNKHTGYGGYGRREWRYGTRVFEFDLDDVAGFVDSWIRYEDGSVEHAIRLDEKYSRA